LDEGMSRKELAERVVLEAKAKKPQKPCKVQKQHLKDKLKVAPVKWKDKLAAKLKLKKKSEKKAAVAKEALEKLPEFLQAPMLGKEVRVWKEPSP
jgi:hypothetical protein